MTTSRKLRTAVAGSSRGGQQAFAQPGTYSFVVPSGVTNISAVCIGGGGGGGGSINGSNASGGGGGALSYSNNIPVTPGETLTVTVGGSGDAGTVSVSGEAGGDSSIARGGTTLVLAKGGGGGRSGSSVAASGGSAASGVGDVRNSGGNSGKAGGGAAGYSGNGGNAAPYTSFTASGSSGSGGGGGGGARTNINAGQSGASGGGVSMYGEGPSGSGGVFGPDNSNGKAGSGGNDGGLVTSTLSAGVVGAIYGSGAGAPQTTGTASATGNRGAMGCVRIMWGAGREFPTTNTQDVGIGFRAKNQTSSGSTIQIPSSTKIGDLIVFIQRETSSSTITPVDPSGFTVIDITSGVLSNTNIRLGVYYKIAVAGDAGSTITGQAAGVKQLMVFSVGNLFSTWTATVGSFQKQFGSSIGTPPTPQVVSSGSVNGPVIAIGSSFLSVSTTTNSDNGLNASPIPIYDRSFLGTTSHMGAVIFSGLTSQNITFSSIAANTSLNGLLSFYIKVN